MKIRTKTMNKQIQLHILHLVNTKTLQKFLPFSKWIYSQLPVYPSKLFNFVEVV